MDTMTKVQDNIKIVAETVTDEMMRMAESYDMYVGAIDNGRQYRDALESNKQILEKLENEGITEFTVLNHAEMMSTTVHDVVLIG